MSDREPRNDPSDDQAIDDDALREQVQSLLRDARRLEPAPPTFGRMWRRAHASTPRRRSLVPALALALLLMLAMAWLGLRDRTGEGGARDAGDVAMLLASVRDVPAMPLDFLLATPGDTFVRQSPRFGSLPAAIHLDAFPLPED